MVDTYYGDEVGFLAYHQSRGRDVTAYSSDDNDVIEAALLVASEWIDSVYRTMFPGLKIGMRAQIREWPRQGGIDIYGYLIPSDSNPPEVINATYEAALRQLVTPGSLSVDWTPNKYKTAAVDGAVSVAYNLLNSAADAQTQFLIIDQILAPILTGIGLGGNVSSLSGRAIRV